ncbi:MAG: ankyrin repeat domain-containing protein [Proteobacteria bacterium]|nr:ankyrin repeat domain-containing protein [Pseudomonadota bacterium]
MPKSKWAKYFEVFGNVCGLLVTASLSLYALLALVDVATILQLLVIILGGAICFLTLSMLGIMLIGAKFYSGIVAFGAGVSRKWHAFFVGWEKTLREWERHEKARQKRLERERKQREWEKRQEEFRKELERDRERREREKNELAWRKEFERERREREWAKRQKTLRWKARREKLMHKVYMLGKIVYSLSRRPKREIRRKVSKHRAPPNYAGWFAVFIALISAYLTAYPFFVKDCSWAHPGFDTNKAFIFFAEKEIKDIRECLDKKYSNVNARNAEGWTPLKVTAWQGNLKATRFLYQKGARIGLPNKNRVTFLHDAAAEGNKIAIEVFHNLTIDMDVKDANGTTPYSYAVDAGEEDAARCLANFGANPNILNDSGFPLLFQAVLDQNATKVAILINSGADVNATDSNGLTALHWAGYVAVASNTATSNFNVGINTHSTPHLHFLHLIAEANAFSVWRSNNDSDTSLQNNAREEALQIFDLLIDEGADVNAKDDNGITPLRIVVDGKDEEVAETLVIAGADSQIRGEDNLTIAELLFEKDNLEGGKILNDIYEGDNDTATRITTPLHFAVSSGEVNVVEFLIKAEANVNIRDDDGITPLHLAVEKNDVVTTEILIKANAKVNIRDDDGFTPLHLALIKNEAETAEILINEIRNSEEEDINARDRDGWTPLHYAARWGDANIVQILIAAEADVNARADSGKTPLDVARNAEDMESNVANVASVEITSSIKHKEVIRILKEAGAH